jgi:hypothetical protein
MDIPTIRYITVATNPHPILKNLFQRVKQNGEDITILGLSEKRDIGWNATGNFGVKLREVYNYVSQSTIAPDDIILFTDAYDVIYAGNQETIVKRYLDGNHPIIFGGETECNPDPGEHVKYIKTDVQFPYLNSGMFIGRVWAIRKCMENYEYDDNHDDQRFWTQNFFKYPDLIKLDYENALFLNTHGIDIEDVKCTHQGTYYHRANPQFIHVNGPNKNDLNRFL